MNKKKYIIGLIGAFLLLLGCWYFVKADTNSDIRERAAQILAGEAKEEAGEEVLFRGRSGPVRDIVGVYGTPTATTTAAATFGNSNDLSSVTTSTDVVGLLDSTDSVLFTIAIPAASSTNFFYWHILGSNDYHCDTAVGTSTDDDSYDPDEPLLGDINWYNLNSSNVTPSGYANYQLTDVVGVASNATGTSFMLKDNNWDCLKTEYRGASTTVLMQMKEKVLTIQ